MPMLQKHDLEEALVDRSIEFIGTIRKGSLLLSLGHFIQFLSKRPGVVDPYDMCSVQEAYGELLCHWNRTVLASHEFALVSTKEYLKLDGSHFGLISTLSHVARLGLMAHAASFFVDPDFWGYLTLEVVNLSPHEVVLYEGMPFAKLVIFECGHKETPFEDNTTEPQQHHYGRQIDLASQFWREFTARPLGEG